MSSSINYFLNGNILNSLNDEVFANFDGFLNETTAPKSKEQGGRGGGGGGGEGQKKIKKRRADSPSPNLYLFTINHISEKITRTFFSAPDKKVLQGQLRKK